MNTRQHPIPAAVDAATEDGGAGSDRRHPFVPVTLRTAEWGATRLGSYRPIPTIPLLDSLPPSILQWELADTSLQGPLALAVALGAAGALPGRGGTLRLWETLATVAATDLGAARVIEPHLDALAILDQAASVQHPGPGPSLPPAAAGTTWGVFAAEGGPRPLIASRTGDRWLLSGVKPWCSLAGTLDAALISATTDTGQRRLFSVDLHDAGVHVEPAPWVARGLSEIPSGPVRCEAVAASPVGDAGWYLDRAGFSWGGIGVAACWYGGAVGLARSLHSALRSQAAGTPAGADRLALMHLGAIDALLHVCRLALSDAAAQVDAGTAEGASGRILAKRVRDIVARTCEETISRVGHALGPAPLALDAAHSKRVADLQLYVRQHHAERDQASLGDALAQQETAPW